MIAAGSIRVLVATLIVATAAPAEAGQVVFAAGGEADVEVVIDGDAVRLLLDGRSYDFRRDDFAEIDPSGRPEDDWPDRRADALEGDASDRYRAAWWALEHGLTDDAVGMLRSAHEADPSLQPVARLVDRIDRLKASLAPPELGPLRESLTGNFKLAEGPHIALLHQHDEAEAAERVAMLEDVLTTFDLVFTAQGFDLRIPVEKLVHVWIAEEADYRTFLRAEAGPAFLTTHGYYHPTRRIVLTQDGRSRGDERRARFANRERLAEVERAADALNGVRPGTRFRLALAGEPTRTVDREGAERILDRLRREVERKAFLLEADRLRADRGTAAHELIHQLVIATGLATTDAAFPIWLHEGLAMQFEVIRGDRWAGFGRVSRDRLADWRALDRPPSLAAVLQGVGMTTGYDRDRYAAFWALTFYLRKERPAAFIAFLDRLRGPSPSRPESADLFADVFGDPAALERPWHRYMETLVER